jgi:hypothetical protein
MGRREVKIMDTVDKIKTFKITERYITEDTWIVEATSEQEARDISLGIDPIKEEFIKSVDTYVEEVFGDA